MMVPKTELMSIFEMRRMLKMALLALESADGTFGSKAEKRLHLLSAGHITDMVRKELEMILREVV